jgi:AhpD family alkylhydroperoxidase
MEDTNELLREVQSSMGKMQKEYSAYMAPFGMFMKKAEGEGALTTKTKELISVALSVTSECKWCIAFHVKNALDSGANKEEIMEACYVAVLMGGGPAMMQMGRVMKALDDLGAK